MFREKYIRSPIVEAICEFHFSPGIEWDDTIPGLIYEELRGEFPKRKQVKTYEVGLDIEKEGIQQNVIATDRVQFIQESDSVTIQISPNYVSINHVAPYTSWENFIKNIDVALLAYRKIAEPTGIKQISIRYLNLINLDERENIELKDYFHFYPFTGSGVPQDFDSFILGIESPITETSKLKIQMTNKSTSIILDITYNYDKGPVFDELFTNLDFAHEHIQSSFEGIITDKLREMFRQEG